MVPIIRDVAIREESASRSLRMHMSWVFFSNNDGPRIEEIGNTYVSASRDKIVAHGRTLFGQALTVASLPCEQRRKGSRP